MATDLINIDGMSLESSGEKLSLQFITVPPASQPPRGLIIALHGWGANAEDLASLVPFLNLPEYQFIFPNAPFPYPHTSTGRAWYDLSNNSYEGLGKSRELLSEFIQKQASSLDIPLSSTVLCGFSQGGAMTLDVGLKLPLAGLVSLSGYLHPQVGMGLIASPPPVLIAHGTKDTVVPLIAAHKARETLQSLGITVKYQEFDMGHEILPETIALLREFISEVIPSQRQNSSQ